MRDCILMNSRGGLPILRGGLPLGTISKDLPIHISADSKRSTWRSTSLPYGIFLEGAGLSFQNILFIYL